MNEVLSLLPDLPRQGKALVYVTSPTCAPCRAATPIVERFAAENEGRVKVVKIDAHAQPEVVAKLNVRATPTYIGFDAGSEFGRVLGGRITREKLAEVVGL